ncbi:MAG: hypothetical protein J5851_05795 [Oscillospiraceae bacterium]|nr:hypothetical protein [Oscillospiraceae bacterium]
MKKRFPFLPVGLSCFGAGVVFFLPSLIMVLRMYFYDTQALEQASIIGGADAPTARLLFSVLSRSPVFWTTMAGCILGLLLLLTGICMIFVGILDRLGQNNNIQL